LALAALLGGDEAVRSGLLRSVLTFPDSFKARVLVGVGPAALRAEQPPEPEGGIAFFNDLVAWWRRQRAVKRARRAKRLLDVKRGQEAVRLLEPWRHHAADVEALWPAAAAQAKSELNAQLTLLKARRSGRASRASTRSATKESEELQRVLWTLAVLEEDQQKRFQYLERWTESFRRGASTPDSSC